MTMASLDEKVYTEGDRSSAGGVVSTVDPDKLDGGVDSPASQYAIAENAYPSGSGRWVKRRGYESLFVPDGETPPYPMALRRWSDGVLVWYSDGSLYHHPDGAEDSVLVDRDAWTPGSMPLTHEEWDNTAYWSDGTTGLWRLTVPEVSAKASVAIEYPDGASTVTLTLTAVEDGPEGNFLVAINDPEAVNSPLAAAISLSLGFLEIELETDGDGNCITTLDELVDYLNDHVTISQYILASTDAVVADPSEASIDFTYGSDVLTFTAVDAGADGNDITITIVAPAASDDDPSVTLNGTDITINLAKDSGFLVQTVADVVYYFNTFAPAGALALVAASGTGTTVVTAQAQTNLAGGSDGGFPLVVPDEPGTHHQMLGGAIADNYLIELVTSEFSFSYIAKRTASEVLFGVDAADPTLVRYCDPYDPTTWDGLSVMAPGGEFVAMIEVGRVMVLAQVDKMFRIDGTDPETWEMVSIGAEGIGCIAPESIKEVEGIILYYSPRGLAFFDGARARPLSDAVFDPNDSTRSLLPAEMAVAARVFTVVTQDHVLVFYPATQATTGCNRAMAYNFRRNTWGGPYVFGFQATCGDCELDAAGANRNVHLGTEAGDVVREYAGYQDLGAAYTMKVRTRDYHFGTITLDKVFREVRVAYEVGNAPVVDPETDTTASSATVRLVCEDETAARSGAERAFTFPGAQTDVIKMAVRAGIRARQAAIEVVHAGDAFFELAEEQVDAFFCRVR